MICLCFGVSHDPLIMCFISILEEHLICHFVACSANYIVCLVPVLTWLADLLLCVCRIITFPQGGINFPQQIHKFLQVAANDVRGSYFFCKASVVCVCVCRIINFLQPGIKILQQIHKFLQVAVNHLRGS